MSKRPAGMKLLISVVTGMIVLVGLFAGAGLSPATTAHAAGIVTDCTTYGAVGTSGTLADALDGGGTITFACSGTIVVPEIIIGASNSTVIDATGQNVTLSGNNANRVFSVLNGGSLTLRNITVANGRSGDFGGGANVESGGSLTMENSTFTGNSTTNSDAWAGAIFNGGTLNITNSAITGNSTAYIGGGIFTEGALTITDSAITGNTAQSDGGGIYIKNPGSTTIQGSTVSGNSGNNGGGILMASSGALTVTNSTLSGNIANAHGGGIGSSAGTTTLLSSTVTANHTDTTGGGLFMQSPAVVSVSNTIVAGNTATNSGPDLGGAITSNDHNLVGDTSGATFTSQANDITGVDPLLDTLKDNGGRTQTHALLTGSPAIDAGETTLTSDQRGVARPQGAADDIGAFEVEAACPTFPVNVASEDELNFAIACYNAKTVAGTYTIILTQNINLTASTTVIDNATAGVELLIEGGDYAVDGQNIGGVRAFTVLQDTTVSIQNMTITRCNVADTVVPGDPNAAAGGAVLVRNGTLTIRSSTLSNNIGTFGGAINNAVGNVTVIDSTLSNNQAITSSVPAVAFGAAIANNGSENEASSLTLINTTVSGNHTPLRGAGIYNGPDAVFTAINSTISGNQADVGGGVVNQPDATMTLHNTIVANSTGGDCVSFSGTINAANSLIEDGLTCVNGTNSNNLTGDPNLGPLQNNGGPTETHALLDGSIAFNAGANALAVDQNGSPLLYDQRGPGFPRVLNGTVDIGAVEIIDPTAVSLYSFRADGADFAMIGLGLLAAVGLLVATGYTLMYRRRA